MNLRECELDESWTPVINKDFKKIVESLENEQGVVYPPKNLVFNAFNLTPLDKVKVVLLGQDPYI